MGVNNLFKMLPGCYIVVHPTNDFLIADVTDAYLKLTRTTKEIIGQPLFDAFQNYTSNRNADTIKNLTDSLKEVIRTHKNHRMPLQRFDTPMTGSAEFEKRFWSMLNIPVIDKAGNLQYIIHSIEDVTDKVMLNQHLNRQDRTTQQQITDAISITQELERMEISQELHDNINQILLTARLYIGRALEKETPDWQMIRSGYELIENAIGEIKNISQALLKTSAAEESMMEGIEDLLHRVMSSGSINVHKTIHLPDESLIESKAKVAVFRIVQEQLSNVIKHAEAKNLFINLAFQENELNLVIKDDGKGFELAEKKPGLGFQNMKSRVAVMDGSISILSQPGDGCTIQVNIPLPAITVKNRQQ